MFFQDVCFLFTPIKQLRHIPGTQRQEHIVQNRKGRGFPFPSLFFVRVLQEEMSYEPDKMLMTSRILLYDFMLHSPVLYGVPEVFFDRGKHLSLQHAKASMPDMSRLMVDGGELRSWPYDATGGKAIRELGYEPVEEGGHEADE